MLILIFFACRMHVSLGLGVLEADSLSVATNLSEGIRDPKPQKYSFATHDADGSRISRDRDGHGSGHSPPFSRTPSRDRMSREGSPSSLCLSRATSKEYLDRSSSCFARMRTGTPLRDFDIDRDTAISRDEPSSNLYLSQSDSHSRNNLIRDNSSSIGNHFPSRHENL